MSNKLSWRDALKQFNDNRVKEGGKYTIPKKGTPEYASVRKLMGDDVDAVPLQPTKTITGQNVAQVNLYAVENGYQIFVFALPEHHASFLQMVRGEADRLYTPTANSETVFLQIKQIFEDLCLGGN